MMFAKTGHSHMMVIIYDMVMADTPMLPLILPLREQDSRRQKPHFAPLIIFRRRDRCADSTGAAA